MIASKSWKPLLLRAGALALLAIAIISTGVLAQENDYRRALRVISDKYHQNFPYLQGEVVAVKGADIFLSVGQNDRAVKGTRLTVLRKGAPFKHPVTGAVLGTLEDEIGVAEIVEVREKFSIARMVKLTTGRNLGPKVKDQVRLSSAKIRIAILPFINKTKEFLSTEVVTRELSSALLSKGRFDVYDVDRLQVWLLDSDVAVDELLKPRNATKLKNQIRRDLVMENTIREVKGKMVLTSRLISLASRKEVFSAVAIADELPFEQRAPKEQTLRRGGGGRAAKGAPNQTFITGRSGIPGQRANVRNFVFSDIEVRGVAIKDVTGDGKNEMVILSSSELAVYRIEGGRMRELARFDEGEGNDFRWLDVGDMNGDGRPEFYIANYRGDDLLSMVLELRGKEFVKLVRNQRIFYRLLRPRRLNPKAKLADKDKYLLLGQYSGFDIPLEGPIYRYHWKGKRSLRRTSPYAMPENLEILGVTLWDTDGDGSPEVVEVGKDDFMRVYSRRGEVRHTSAARYGAPVNIYDMHPQHSDLTERYKPKLYIRSRLLVVDTDGDGVEELLTISNEYAGSRLVPTVGVSSGVIVSLVWDGSGLSEIWRSQKLNGGIVDFAFGDADNDGLNDLLVVAAGESRLFAGGKSTVYLYTLAP